LKVVVIYFKVLSQYFPGRTEKKTTLRSQDILSMARSANQICHVHNADF